MIKLAVYLLLLLPATLAVAHPGHGVGGALGHALDHALWLLAPLMLLAAAVAGRRCLRRRGRFD